MVCQITHNIYKITHVRYFIVLYICIRWLNEAQEKCTDNSALSPEKFTVKIGQNYGTINSKKEIWENICGKMFLWYSSEKIDLKIKNYLKNHRVKILKLMVEMSENYGTIIGERKFFKFQYYVSR